MANETYGSLAAQAAAYLANSQGTVGEFCGVQLDIRRQAERLVDWARSQGIFLTDFCTTGLEKYNEPTREHVVYFGFPRNSRVIKCTKPGKFGYAHGPTNNRTRFCDATPLFYLRRLELMNRVFGADLLLEGISLGTTDFDPAKLSLSPYIITTQRYVEPANKKDHHPTEPQIENFMKSLNFSLFPESIYNWIRVSDGVIVLDTKSRNFITSPEGIVPIDLIVGQPDQI